MIITAIRIGDGNVIDYFCEWWDEKTRCQDWFLQCSAASLQIGFHSVDRIFSQGDISLLQSSSDVDLRKGILRLDSLICEMKSRLE